MSDEDDIEDITLSQAAAASGPSHAALFEAPPSTPGAGPGATAASTSIDGGTAGDPRARSKWITDTQHGMVRLSPDAVAIIDTPPFQRLRDLYQLGCAYWVWPCAAHKRFEHCIGTYHLAETMMQNFFDRSRHVRSEGAEIDINREDVQMVSIAGLVHDLGHGPFSHVFDSEVVRRLSPGIPRERLWTHEQMTCKMFDWMCDEYALGYDESQRKLIHDLVTASEDKDLERHKRRERPWLYEVVSNPRNSIDVDKFDYLQRDARATGVGGCCNFERLVKFARVLDGEVCWWSKDAFNLYQLFHTRASMHKTVYTHPKVKAVEYMVTDALVAAHAHLGLRDAMDDPELFVGLSDYVLKLLEHARPVHHPRKGSGGAVRAAADAVAAAQASLLGTAESDDWEGVRTAQGIIRRLNRRQVYKYIGQAMIPQRRIDAFDHKKVCAEDIVACQPNAELQVDDVIVHNQTINFSMGSSNPITRVSFFTDWDVRQKEPIDKDQVSSLLPDHFQEKSVRVFCRSMDKTKQEAAEKALEQFVRKNELVAGAQTPGTPIGVGMRTTRMTDSAARAQAQSKRRRLEQHPDCE